MSSQPYREDEETPRPWHLKPCSNGGAILYRPQSRHQDHLQVLTIADAQLIVRAVNSLDPLMDALERALAESGHSAACMSLIEPVLPCNCWRTDAHEALAKSREPIPVEKP